uniref:Uncharacterized protein n=1 Tax=Chenopodium quinoa TaxID=63459 RepID=A0A803MB84_CHEQI
MNPATREALKDVAPKENKLVLKKRRAPIEVASLEVVEKTMVGVTQSSFQSGTTSSLVAIPKEVLKVKPTCRKKKAKIDEDEEEDEENKSNVLGRGVVKPRHTIQLLMNLVVALENQVHKLQAIKNMGFGGFLHLDLPKNSPEFATMLVDKLEINEMCIVCGRNQVLSIEAIDVHLVYGVPLGGKKIVEAKPGEKEYDELVRQFKGYHGGRVPTLTDLAIHLCLETTPLDDDWRRSFLVLVVNSYDSQVATPMLKQQKFEEAIDDWLVDNKMKSVKGFQLFDALKKRYTFELLTSNLNPFDADVRVRAKRFLIEKA